MKKLLIIGFMFLAAPALAATICAEDDVVAIVLDPQIVSTASATNVDTFEWSVTFPYGIIWGITTCIDTSGSTGVAVEELRSLDGELVTGGERKGQYCWCKMTHPASSGWVFRDSVSSTDACRRDCPSRCVYSIRYDSGFRGSMFESSNQ